MRIFVFFMVLMTSYAIFAGISSAQKPAETEVKHYYMTLLQYLHNTRYYKTTSGKVWDDNLGKLLVSPSPEGDKYLADLAFFSLDGWGSQSFRCAIELRRENHPDTIDRQLTDALEKFENRNPCIEFNKTVQVSSQVLVCVTKEDFKNYVDAVTAPEQPKAESEVDCSEYF